MAYGQGHTWAQGPLVPVLRCWSTIGQVMRDLHLRDQEHLTKVPSPWPQAQNSSWHVSLEVQRAGLPTALAKPHHPPQPILSLQGLF